MRPSSVQGCIYSVSRKHTTANLRTPLVKLAGTHRSLLFQITILEYQYTIELFRDMCIVGNNDQAGTKFTV